MSFLTKIDLITVADTAVVDKITNANDAIVTQIIAESISMMKGYLSKYYDVETEFAKEGAARHLTILKRLKDIVIYEIWERHTRDRNQVAERRYNEAMKWLEELNSGEQSDETITAKPVATEQTGINIRFGGNTRYNSIF